MEIDKAALTILASDCHTKQVRMQDLHNKLNKKTSTAEDASEYAIAKVEYQRSKNLLELEISNQSVTIINSKQESGVVFNKTVYLDEDGKR